MAFSVNHLSFSLLVLMIGLVCIVYGDPLLDSNVEHSRFKRDNDGVSNKNSLNR